MSSQNFNRTGLDSRKGRATLFVVLLAALLCRAAVTCAGERQVHLVTSVFPLTLIVREVGGERIAVDTLVPPGASPHTFEPVPSDLVRLQRARYFIRVGGGLDGWSNALLGAAPASLETVTLLNAVRLEPLNGDTAGNGHHRHSPASGEDVGYDPHFWLDPLRVRDVVVPLITRRLIDADPDGKVHYEARAADFQQRLTVLYRRIRDVLGQAQGQKYVAFHNAWRYFAERYGLEEVAVVQEFAGEEPTPKEVANLVRGARAAGISKILVEPQLNPRIAQNIASEFGADTVVVDPLGDPNDPARSTYEQLMLFNARAFTRALGGTEG